MNIPYGETWVHEKVSEDIESMPFRFTGKEQDPETDLYYFGARYYDARLSRWITADRILYDYLDGKRGGGGVYNSINLNLYHYASNNPIRFIDPDGNESVGGEEAKNFIGLGQNFEAPLGARTNESGEPINSTHQYKGSGKGKYPDTSGSINIIQSQKGSNKEFWKQFNPGYGKSNIPTGHHDDLENLLIDIGFNERDGKSDWYGPNQKFKVSVNLHSPGFGSRIDILMGNKELRLAHFTEIDQRAIDASKSNSYLPAGAFLGYTRRKIGKTSGPHLHMQGWQDGQAATRETYWPWLLGN